MLVKFYKNKKPEKMLAILLIITMTFANVLFLGKNLISYAFEENLEMQRADTQHTNVKFDAYFSDNGGNNIHSVIFDVANNIQKMNLYISVKNAGYLKEAYIDFRDDSKELNTNYDIVEQEDTTTLVQKVNTDLKTISLNYVTSGTEAIIEMPIKMDLGETTQINNLRKDSLVTLRGLYVDENGEETEISKTIKLNIGWTLETELNIEQAITKYVPYNYNGQTGLILQTQVKAKQNRDDKVLPVKETEINIKVPEIADTLPEEVTVYANSTMATNGNKVEFTEENWEYNEQEKMIKINTKGYETDGIAWSGIGADEYFITYLYSDEAYQHVLENIPKLQFEAEGKMTLYSAEGTTIKTASSIGEIELSEKIGDIITYNIDINEQEISKGKIYANYNSEEKTYNTEYNSMVSINVSNNEIVDEIYFKLPASSFIKEEQAYSTSIAGTHYVNHNKLTINKEKMQKILGEDGYIQIQDNFLNTYIIKHIEIEEETEKQNTITYLEETDENYIVTLTEGVGELTIKTSKPEGSGILEINIVKSISKDIPCSKDQMKEFTSLKETVEGYVKNIPVQTVEDTLTLTETSTNAVLEISNTELSTMVENKNIEMRIIFNNNTENSDLYKAPVFTINLPKYIEDIEITGGNIAYSNGLEVDYVEKNYTENGIVLTIYTKGAETSFSNGSYTNGANILLNTNIKVNMLTPNISDKIIMRYTNESANSYVTEENGQGINSIDINFIAPEEMVALNTVSVGGAELTSINGNEQTAKLEILSPSKTVTMKSSILNKYSNICNNIRILGRLPFEGNKDISTLEDLGTTFDAQLTSLINTNGINAIIYYSENANATEDLNDINNGWETDITKLSQIKSYLIILPDYEIATGETLEFAYDLLVPSGLEHNESAYGTYVVYYDSVSEYISSKTADATKVGLTTGIGANLETDTKIVYQGNNIDEEDIVKEYQYITYQTTVENTGSVDATGVKINSNILNGDIQEAEGATINGNFATWDIGNVLAGESKTVEYTVKVGTIKEIEIELKLSGLYSKTSGGVTKYYIRDAEGNEQEVNLEDYYKIYNKITITAENFESQLEEQIENKIEKAQMQISLNSGADHNIEYTKGFQISYTIVAKNIAEKDLENVQIQVPIPKGFKFVELEGAEYNENTRIVTYNIEKLEDKKSISLRLKVETELSDGQGQEEPVIIATAQIDNEDKYYSNKYKTVVIGPVISLEQTANLVNNSYINENTDLNISIKVKNTGKGMAKSLKIQEFIPAELKVQSSQCIVGEKTYKLIKNNDSYLAYIELEPNEEAVINIILNGKLSKDVEEKKVELYAKVSADDVSEKTSNKLSYILEKSNTASGDPSNPNIPTTSSYKISGVAWLDENENGIKDETEQLLENIDVLLIDANTGVIVTDRANGTMKQTKTASDGSYTFTNLPAGKYAVIFEYNSAHYDITQYKKQGQTEDVTSKAMEAKISKDGKIQIAGITDTINISNTSIANINIGLIEKPKFDLSLEKTISKIILENADGTKTYDFQNTKLAKIEIPGNKLKNSKVYVEYKITIKNEGAIAGYAKKIVDYVSPDFVFNGDNNITWSKGEDGNLYNESLAETLINPGEEKELTLTLLKVMTEDNTGIVTNLAEIYETYNEQNLQDYDSTEANNAQEEDDLDYADALISVKTGQIFIYITIALTCITIITLGVYFINKKVLKGGRI